ncbi:MAG: ATP-binding protein [Rhodoferax sp.]
MPAADALTPDLLYTVCDPATLGFSNTQELSDLDASAIHTRAIEAMHLGLDIRHEGYNLFVLGDTGSGRHAMVRRLLEEERHHGDAAADWCYVYNFTDATRPQLLRLPCGRGPALRDDMQHFVEQLTPAINAVFQSNEYRDRISALQEEAKQREEQALKALGDDAAAQDVGLIRTPQGFMLVPMKDKETPLTTEEFAALASERQQTFTDTISVLHERMQKLLKEFPRWRQEAVGRMKQTGSEALHTTLVQLMDDIKPRYADLPAVAAYLEAVLQDITETGESLHASSKSEGDTETTTYTGSISVQRYLVNLLVENPVGDARPVVYEDHPTLQNLVGRIEHQVHMGTLVSDFTLIRAGALHRANGGFLILDALKVLSQPYAWEGIKRCLQAGQVRIESLSDLIGLTSTVQLEPEPVPLELKIVLIGERLVYYLLTQYDPDFATLFRINADMESDIRRNPDNTLAYARLVATLARNDGMRPLTASAVARVIEHAARLANDAQRLTTQTQPLDNLIREADHFAQTAQAPLVDREHIEAALAAHQRRHARYHERYQEEVVRGQLLVDTTGAQVGQINGLAVVSLGDSTFAHPVRITATVRVGDGEVVDIEREVKLGGPIHSKGVLILSSFIASRFGRHMPLSLKASLVFEQSYGGVEGDSASLAELAALLSAIAGVPLRQSLAVTGSVNQFGVVQAVGGINEKIEGFFDLCHARGLSGEQGVLIPASNVCHLMLRSDVVEAVRAGRFFIWPVAAMEEAMERLTGLPMGTLDEQGQAPDGTVYARVAAGLRQLTRLRREFGKLTTPPDSLTQNDV